jgi:hypothetical protein
MPRLKRGEDQLQKIGFDGAEVELTFTALDHGLVVETPQPQVQAKKPLVSKVDKIPPRDKPDAEVEELFKEVAV